MYPVTSEREPAIRQETTSAPPSTPAAEGWPTTAMAIALTTLPDPVYDPAYEWGTRLVVGPLEAPTRLEVYEERTAIRITSKDLRVEIHRPTEITVFHDNVVFAAGRREEGTYLHARVDREGNAALLLDQPSPPRPAEVVGTQPAVPSHVSAEIPIASPAPTTAGASKEKQPTVTVTGKLQTTPRAGNPDAKGRQTAWALVAVYVEGEDSPHLYSATFHRQTVKTALGLPRDAQVTIKGYAHPKQGEQRNDTFSVIAIVEYPGKPAKER